MRLDSRLLFSNEQEINGDAVSTDYVNFGSDRDVGSGEPMWLVSVVDEAFNTLTSLNFNLQTADNSSFSSAVTLLTVNKLLADLTLNARALAVRLPLGIQQYLRMQYDVVGTDPTTGKLTTFITQGIQNWKPYAKNYAV